MRDSLVGSDFEVVISITNVKRGRKHFIPDVRELAGNPAGLF